MIPREERDRFQEGIPIGAKEPLAHESSESVSEMTQTKETGYLITIGLLARMRGDADDIYLKPDDTVNVKGVAQALENSYLVSFAIH